MRHTLHKFGTFQRSHVGPTRIQLVLPPLSSRSRFRLWGWSAFGFLPWSRSEYLLLFVALTKKLHLTFFCASTSFALQFWIKSFTSTNCCRKFSCTSFISAILFSFTLEAFVAFSRISSCSCETLSNSRSFWMPHNSKPSRGQSQAGFLLFGK